MEDSKIANYDINWKLLNPRDCYVRVGGISTEAVAMNPKFKVAKPTVQMPLLEEDYFRMWMSALTCPSAIDPREDKQKHR